MPDAAPDDVTAAAAPATRRRGRRDAPRRRRRWPWVLLAVVVILLALAGWLAWRATQVVDALEGAVPAVRQVQEDLRAGDVAAATAGLPALAEGADRASAATADPVWRAATVLPWVGDQLGAVTDVVRAFDLVATDVVPALTEVGAAADPRTLTASAGRIDLGPLVAAAPRLESAGDAADEALAVLEGIDREPLVAPLARRVDEATEALGEASGTLGAARTAASLLPPMLGVEEPRTYLVLVLNPAELRSGGGIVGALAQVTADDGAITLTDQRPAGTIPSLDAPVLPLSEGELAVHSDQLGRVVQNATMSPDLPRAAELAAAFWERETGVAVDGALALDPVALGYLLQSTGPVQAPEGVVLDAENAARVLLHEAYGMFPDNASTDAFFAGAAGSVFGALASGQAELGGLLGPLQQGSSEGRLGVWSRHAEEQALLGPSVVGGAFLSGAAPGAAGVFLDDVTATKLDYFLGTDVSVVDVACRPDGDDAGTTAVLRLRLESGVPADFAALPPYVTTIGTGETPTGQLRTNVTFWAPEGATLGAVERDGAAVGARRAQEAGREVAVLTSTLGVGESETYDVELRLPPGSAAPAVWSTPTVSGSGRLPASACS